LNFIVLFAVLKAKKQLLTEGLLPQVWGGKTVPG